MLSLPSSRGYRVVCRDPWFLDVDGGLEVGFYSVLDEVVSLGQGLLHVGAPVADDLGNQPGDKTQSVAGASGADCPGGGVGEAVVDNGGDAFGIGEPASLDET